jgi:hypothetical protein
MFLLACAGFVAGARCGSSAITSHSQLSSTKLLDDKFDHPDGFMKWMANFVFYGTQNFQFAVEFAFQKSLTTLELFEDCTCLCRENRQRHWSKDQLVPNEKYIPCPSRSVTVSLVIDLSSETELVAKLVRPLR